jgi:hypothetical protein
MKTEAFWDLGLVSDAALRCDLAALLANGYRTEARIVAHIAEVDARKLHTRDGSSSLFEYCVRQLGLSESEAFYRLTAARIARRFPVVFSLLERRAIHLTAVCLLRDYLTSENQHELLAEASHKTKLQVQELLARRYPRPDVASYVRKLPPRATCEASKHPTHREPVRFAEDSSQPPSVSTAAATRTVSAPAPAPAPALPPRASFRASVEPTSAARYRIQLNASSALKEKLELFQALVSHSIPRSDLAAVLERALDLALEQVQKQRFAQTNRPRQARPDTALELKRSGSQREHIANATQRQVAVRDELRCTYVSDAGCRCSARAFLQLHHERPWARGGSSGPENLRLLCASHNALLAERDFGAEHVAERLAARRRERTLRPAKLKSGQPSNAP